ncbi:MAG: Propionyl-CoA thioesterase activity, partial [uncultured Nocardioides sp.]
DRHSPTDPPRLRRVAHGHHALARRRRLRAPQQRDVLRAVRHRGQRPPLRGHRSRRPRPPADRGGGGDVVPLLPGDRVPPARRDGAGRRPARHQLGHLPDRAVPGRGRRGGCGGAVRARLRRQHPRPGPAAGDAGPARDPRGRGAPGPNLRRGV